MNRLVAIVLVPILVVGNSFAHTVGAIAHQSPCKGRAHYHVGTASIESHRSSKDRFHSCDDQADSLQANVAINRQTELQHNHLEIAAGDRQMAPFDHDSDAIYLDSVDWFYVPSSRHLIKFSSVVELVQNVTGSLFEACHCVTILVRQIASLASVAIYLLNAALRL